MREICLDSKLHGVHFKRLTVEGSGYAKLGQNAIDLAHRFDGCAKHP